MVNFFDFIENGEKFQKDQISLLEGFVEAELKDLSRGVYYLLGQRPESEAISSLIMPSESKLKIIGEDTAKGYKEIVLSDKNFSYKDNFLKRRNGDTIHQDIFTDGFLTNNGVIVLDPVFTPEPRSWGGYLNDKLDNIFNIIGMNIHMSKGVIQLDEIVPSINRIKTLNEQILSFYEQGKLTFPASLEQIFGLEWVNSFNKELSTIKNPMDVHETKVDPTRKIISSLSNRYTTLIGTNLLKQIKGQDYKAELPYLREIFKKHKLTSIDNPPTGDPVIIFEADIQLAYMYRQIAIDFGYNPIVVHDQKYLPTAIRETNPRHVFRSHISPEIGRDNLIEIPFKPLERCNQTLAKVYSFYKIVESTKNTQS